MRPSLKTLLVAVFAIAIVGATVPASADPPTRERFHDEGWFTLPDIACDGFTLTEVMDSEYVQVTTYYDRAGEAIKIATRANFFGTITNTASGNTYRDHASFTETIDLRDGTTSVSGISYHYIVKGQGQVFAEIGHKIWVTDSDPPEVLFQGGQDDYVNDPDLLSLCEHLV